MGDFSHLSQTGAASMVDIAGKTSTSRTATVSGPVTMPIGCRDLLSAEAVQEIVRTARIAGIQAAKQTAFLIPLCHQVALTSVAIDIHLDHEQSAFLIAATGKTESSTGVEMEAFTAASVAGLTVYDMIKAVAPEAQIGPFLLIEKRGGKAGLWTRDA